MVKSILITTSAFDIKNFQSEILEKLNNNKIKIIFNPHQRRLKENEVLELLRQNVIGMIAGVEPLTQKVLQTASTLKVISRCGVGLDNIDLEAAQDLQIQVYNTPDAPTIAVAEFTIALMLNLIRHISIADQMVRRGEWKALMGNLLSEKTIGIVGFGRIGKSVHTLLRAFGAEVLVCDLRTDALPNNVAHCSLDYLLQSSDIVTLHVPYSADNHYLINETTLARMKPNAILVNTSRGDLIQESALYQALKSKRLAGAALDVYSSEPYHGQLIELPNILLTAHMGGYAHEARNLMEQQAVDNLMKGLEIN